MRMRFTMLWLLLGSFVLAMPPADSNASQDESALQSPANPAAPAAMWATSCSGVARQGALDCAMEQSVVQTETNQLVLLFSVRVPADTRSAVMMIQLPLGLYVPAGLSLRVDDAAAVEFPIQTCDGTGCFVGSPVTPDLLAQLQSGQTLTLTFQNLAQAAIELPITLEGFAAAYDSIK